MRNFIFVGALISTAFATQVASAQSFSIRAEADTMLVAAQAGNNYGGAGGISVAAAGRPRGEFQSVLRFDAADVADQLDALWGVGQWSIASISLTLTSTTPNNALFNQQAAGSVAVNWLENDAWVEGTGGPSSPTVDGLAFAGLPGIIGPNDDLLGSVVFGETNGVAWSGDLIADYGIASDISSGSLISLRLSAGDAGVSGTFNSRNFGTEAARPALTIVAVPEPASLATMFIGVGIAIRRW